MKLVDTLMNEHRLIEKVLDALERFVGGIDGTQEDKAELLRFVEFIQKFADRFHHGKEEDILFDEMARAGFPRDSGPLAVMYHEHEQGRAHVRELERLGEQVGPWRSTDREALTKAAVGFITLLRQHIRKEDEVLYPMAESRLPAEAVESVARRVEAFEANESEEGLRRLGEGLAARHPSSSSSTSQAHIHTQAGG